MKPFDISDIKAFKSNLVEQGGELVFLCHPDIYEEVYKAGFETGYFMGAKIAKQEVEIDDGRVR